MGELANIPEQSGDEVASADITIAHKTKQQLLVGLGVWAVASLYFVANFDPGVFRPAVDAAWLLASMAWFSAFWRADKPSQPAVGHPLWMYALYVAALLPFTNDWRWVMAADTHSYAFMGIGVADHGPYKSLLSVDGPDQFGYLQMNLDHIFMYIFSPTAFWSRIGKITVATLTMAAIFTVMARLVTRPFGMLVALCSASCSTWIVYTYGHFPFLNGIAAGYALVAIALWVRRDFDSRRAWMALGGLSGFMLFLTPNGWFMAPFVWTWLGIIALARRNVLNVFLGLATTVVVGLPMLLQWGGGEGGQLFSLVGDPEYTWAKVWSFFVQAATYPYASQVYDAGGFGPQLPQGFRWIFVASVLITPLFAKRFPGSRFMFLLLLWNVVVVALTQGPYAGVSVKRALILIPMATYFVFIPFWRYLRSIPLVLAIAGVWAALGVSDLLYNMAPGRTGYTIVDGAMEAYQRFGPDVCLYLHDGRSENFKEGSSLNRFYSFWPSMHLTDDPRDPNCKNVICYCLQEQCKRLDPIALGYTPLTMLNSVELGCARIGPADPTRAGPGQG